MERVLEVLEDGQTKVIEPTGEIWFSPPDYKIIDGYRIYKGIEHPILTDDEIKNAPLHFFQIDHYDSYPAENDHDFSYFEYCKTDHYRSVAERVARVRIAQKLNLINNISDKSEEK